ncbi:MAG: hypothetical protein ACKOSQ_07630 [Planctomycetaceae bacterium]
MNLRRPRFQRVAVHGCLCIAALAGGAGVLGQDKTGAPYDEWRLVEPAQEMQDYKAALRDGSFDEASRKFLLEIALPQLGMRKNRAAIDAVRRRMREVLCGEGGGDPKAATSAMQIVKEFMTGLARDKKADLVTRVNAALLVGELRGGNKPWTPAVAPLAEMLGDDALPAAVRIAAAAGLARHVEADPEARATDVGPKLVAVAGSPLAGLDPVAADWLRSRALSMLARMGPAAPNGTGAMAATVLADAQRPIDVRVRAAAAAGRCVKAPGDTDVAAAISAIRAVADAALAATKAATDRRERALRLAGVAAGQLQAKPQAGVVVDGVPAGGTTQAYRRDAWRLATLADALATPAGDAGLARFAGPAAVTATDMARALREGAARLDAQPDSATLDAAIQGLAATGKPAAAADGTPATGKPAAVPEPADGIPFGEK